MKLRTKLPWITLVPVVYLAVEGVRTLIGLYAYLSNSGQYTRGEAIAYTAVVPLGFLFFTGVVALALHLGRLTEEEQARSSERRGR